MWAVKKCGSCFVKQNPHCPIKMNENNCCEQVPSDFAIDPPESKPHFFLPYRIGLFQLIFTSNKLVEPRFHLSSHKLRTPRVKACIISLFFPLT